MNPGGTGRTSRLRVSREDRMKYDRMLSERHINFWGNDCPAVDLDFLMAEYNHGIAVAIVDYKYHGADLAKTNAATYKTLSELYDPNGMQLPLFIARYWPDCWAFHLIAVNEAARSAALRVLPTNARYDEDRGEVPLTEQQYVWFLHRLRKEALTEADKRVIGRLNNYLPPELHEAA